MNRFALIGAGLLSIGGLVGTGAAADLPARAYTKAPPVELFSWTGCFIGAHVGGAFSDDRTTNLIGQSAAFGKSGFVGGGQIGCDYQFAPDWVVGVEGSAAWSGLKSQQPAIAINLLTGATVPAQFTVRNDFLASATARIGYSGVDHVLVYARGGAAWTNEKVNELFVAPGLGPVNPATTTNRTGWTIGSGVEWAFAPHWSTTFEYNYYDFGSRGITLFDPARNVTLTGLTLRDTIHAFTVGVNYRF
jgi:outer membrane immunogenic protein